MNMTDFKERLIRKIKVCGQMMIDMAEDIAGETDWVSKLTVTAEICNGPDMIPALVITRSHLPDANAVQWIFAEEKEPADG